MIKGSIAMIIQNRDGFSTREPGRRPNKRQHYYAMVPAYVLDQESTIIDDLIGFALDTLGAQCLDVRVYEEATFQAPIPATLRPAAVPTAGR
jgi:hypothetical protein